MPKRRSRAGFSWKQEYGGVPAWGIAAAVGLLVALLAAPAVVNATTPAAAPYVRPSDAFAEPTPGPVVKSVVYIGDSYTAGDVLAPNDKTTARWPAVLAELTDSRELNHGYGGTGYTTPGPFTAGTTYLDRLSEIDTVAPEVVIVSGGRNDQDPALYAQATAEFFPALRARFPDAQIIAVEPFWDASEYPARLVELSGLVQANVERVGGIYLAGPGQALIGHPEWILEDAVHPNIDGHAQLAASVKAALDTAGVSLAPTVPE